MKKLIITSLLILSNFLNSAWALNYEELKNDPHVTQLQTADKLSFDKPFTSEQIKKIGFFNSEHVSDSSELDIYLQDDSDFSFYGLHRNMDNPLDIFHFVIIADKNKINELQLVFQGDEHFNLLISNLYQQLRNPSNVTTDNDIKTITWGLNYYINDDGQKKIKNIPIVVLMYNKSTHEGQLQWVSPEFKIKETK